MISAYDAMRAISRERGDALAITTCTPAQYWSAVSEQSELDIQLPGTMGKASSLALGLALSFDVDFERLRFVGLVQNPLDIRGGKNRLIVDRLDRVAHTKVGLCRGRAITNDRRFAQLPSCRDEASHEAAEER